MPSTSAGVPATMRAAIDANVELKEALIGTQMPRRFQAMVLGLTALRQLNTHKPVFEGELRLESPKS